MYGQQEIRRYRKEKGENEMKDREDQIFESGEKNDAFAQYFVGQSYLNMLTTSPVGVANVTFEPACSKLDYVA